MNKIIVSLVTAWFLATISGPVFAAQATSMATPAAKAMKHKRTGHKWGKKSKKSKPAPLSSKTPVAK